MVIPEDQLQRALIARGLATEADVAQLWDWANSSNLTIEEALLEKGIVTDRSLMELYAQESGIPLVEISRMQIIEDVFRVIPERIVRKYKIAAFARDQEGLKVAMQDPSDRELLELLAHKVGQQILPHLTTRRDIRDTLQLYRKDLQSAFDTLVAKESRGKEAIVALDEAPITKIVDLLIDYSYQSKTSDIHLEPQEHNSLVRFRIDGVLHDVLLMPKSYHDRVVTRIKVLSKLRTDEHLAAQDGKMTMKLEEENLDIRVSILPIVDGEKVVMRLLSSKSRDYSLSSLGMSEKDLAKVQAAYSKSYGMILSTGPTGSGKSTSIYAILKNLNTREKNITTIEDPIEYRLQGVNQIQVNPKANLTFASGLRSILRQDPNIVFVGEIRDAETAGIAVNAALTGHLVLSTLHTNDAATALPRLIDMKIEPFLAASTVNVIVAQRLIRRICETCRVEYKLSEEELFKNFPETLIKKAFIPQGEDKKVTVYRGSGCKLCHETGYRGRIGIFEVLEVTPAIKKLIVEKADSHIIEQQAKHDGMGTMLEDGLQKVAQGIATIEEVLRATKVEIA